jgi:hypothetical protein
MLLLFSIIAYLAGEFTQAAPVSRMHPTGPAEPPYVSNSNRRGTIDIILSSIITLTLCVYTSIHLNITPPKKFFGIRTICVYKLYWVLIGMFAHEFVLYAAYIQWRNSKIVCKILNELDRNPENSQPTPPVTLITQRRWSHITMVSAFYIVMGGFAFDVCDLTNDYQYIALTPKGFIEFAKAGLITPDILKDDDIADRSKADSLGKLLVCVQAFWMAVNIFARKISNLPSTLIEVNMMIHVLITIAVYGLWWHKPLAVANSTLLPRQRTSAAGQTAAANMGELNVPEIALLAFLLRSHRPSFEYLDQCEWSGSDTPEPYPADRNHKEFKVNVEAYIPDPQKFEIRGSPRDPRPICNNLVAKLKIKSPGLILLPGQQLVLKMHRYVLVNPEYRSLAVFISIDELHWLDLEYSYRQRLQTGGLLEMNEAMRNIISNPHDLTTFDPPNYSVQGSVYSVGIQTADWIGDLMDSPSLLFMTQLLNISYASPHASAYILTFPSYIERWAWLSACVCIALGVPFVCAVCLPLRALKNKAFLLQHPMAAGTKKSIIQFLYKLIQLLFWVCLGLAAILYTLARLFIPVEAFISMRSVPVGSFDTVPWMEYWPHV